MTVPRDGAKHLWANGSISAVTSLTPVFSGVFLLGVFLLWYVPATLTPLYEGALDQAIAFP